MPSNMNTMLVCYYQLTSISTSLPWDAHTYKCSKGYLANQVLDDQVNVKIQVLDDQVNLKILSAVYRLTGDSIHPPQSLCKMCTPPNICRQRGAIIHSYLMIIMNLKTSHLFYTGCRTKSAGSDDNHQ